MNSIKYVVVCKRGYMFTSSKGDIKEFIDKHGKDIAYYVGHFNPLENLDFINNPNTDLKKLGDEKND